MRRIFPIFVLTLALVLFTPLFASAVVPETYEPSVDISVVQFAQPELTAFEVEIPTDLVIGLPGAQPVYQLDVYQIVAAPVAQEVAADFSAGPTVFIGAGLVGLHSVLSDPVLNVPDARAT